MGRMSTCLRFTSCRIRRRFEHDRIVGKAVVSASRFATRISRGIVPERANARSSHLRLPRTTIVVHRKGVSRTSVRQYLQTSMMEVQPRLRGTV